LQSGLQMVPRPDDQIALLDLDPHARIARAEARLAALKAHLRQDRRVHSETMRQSRIRITASCLLLAKTTCHAAPSHALGPDQRPARRTP
jgi:hypothetical protein